MPSSGFTLLGDQPYSRLDDPLGFQKAVEGIETLILGSRDSTPFTLGIEGSWGVGKSTLMAALRERLTENRPEITVAQFNAWTAEDGRVLEGFVKTVLGAVKPTYLRNALLKQKAIRLTRFGLSGVAGVIGQSRTVEKVWDAVASDPRARNELRDLVEATIESWRKSQGGTTRLLCVFVDDLDRCYPGVVLEVLEAMKLYLDVPGIVFVVGYDEDIVTEVVLGKKDYGEKTTARSYLEKFIQISYRIPRAEEVQSKALIEELLEASGTGELLGETERRLVLDGSGSNPRRIKRFLNSFVLAYELGPRWRRFKAKSLVRVLLLQMYFPEFSRLLEDPSERDRAEEFLEYEMARGVLLRESPHESEEVNKALLSHGLPEVRELEKTPRELLDMLERLVPAVYPQLADRPDFVSLVRSLFDGKDWKDLREAFSGGALAQLVSAETDQLGFAAAKYSGLRVLWVDDNMAGNEPLVYTLRQLGAEVVTAEDEEGMVAELTRKEFDLLISDIARGEDEEAGLAALERLRQERPGQMPRKLIFFVAKLTRERDMRARQLGAVIVTDPQLLLDYVSDVALSKR